MTEHHWVRITPCENIPPREGRAVTVGGRELAVFNLGPAVDRETGPSTALGTRDRFLATDNQCPHQGGPLCDGIVTGSSVVCPLHAWKVNLASGSVERPAGAKDHCVTTYPVRVEHGIVVIGLPVPHGADAVSRAAAGDESSNEVAA
jgi:nitrite reductase (NADH) small subunit